MVWLVTVDTAFAQDDTNFEIWPETDIWYKVTPAWRFSAFAPVTRYVESEYREFNLYLQVDYSWGHTKRTHIRRLLDENRAGKLKTWMVRPGYMGGWSLGDHTENYTEDMLFVDLHKRIPIAGAILLSHRVRPDFRWVGQNAVFSYRFRYRLMVEKELISGNTSIVPYVNVEPYYDSRYDFFNRVRVIGGAAVACKSRFAFEGNITYQYDSKAAFTHIYALNLIFHLYFETARARQP